jgi:hypothetical protein
MMIRSPPEMRLGEAVIWYPRTAAIHWDPASYRLNEHREAARAGTRPFPVYSEIFERSGNE